MKKDKLIKDNIKLKRRKKMGVLYIILLIFLLLYFSSLFLILGWGIITSFKDNLFDFRINIIGFPKKWIFDNYMLMFSEFAQEAHHLDGTTTLVKFPMLLLNSVTYSIGSAFVATLVPCITAYLCARYNYKFSKVMYFVVIVTMVMPIVGNLPSEIMVVKFLGMYDHIWGLWIMKANFLGVYFLVFHALFKGMPKEYIEAPKVDGAGNMSILIRIMLPLAKNTFFTIMLLNFITFWNDYTGPLVYLPAHPVLSTALFNISQSVDAGMTTVPVKMAAAMILFIPIFILFTIFQNRIVGNLTVGGIKG